MRRRSARDRLVLVMLVVSSMALLGTSAPVYEPEIGDQLEQQVTLDAARPGARTTFRVVTSESTLPARGSGHNARLSIEARADDADAELALTVSSSADDRETRGDEIIELVLDDVCVAEAACDTLVTVGVEWIDASPDHEMTVTVRVDAGIDYTNGLMELRGVPGGASLELAVVDELVATEDESVRRRTEPEALELTSTAPFVLRHAWVELDATGGGVAHADVVFSAESDDELGAQVAVWADGTEYVAAPVPIGGVTPVTCPAGQTCRFGFTLVAEWDGRSTGDRATVRWSLAAVLRSDGAGSQREDALRIGVDRSVSTGGAAITVTAGGSIEARPGDTPFDVPTQPGDGPHLVEAVLRTWSPVPGGEFEVGIPTTGELVVTARRADGAPLEGPVRIGIVTRLPVIGNMPLRRTELTPSEPSLVVALKPSFSCSDVIYLDPEPPDGRCSVPFDLYVQPPDASTGPIVVEWSITIHAFELDGLELDDGDLVLVTGAPARR